MRGVSTEEAGRGLGSQRAVYVVLARVEGRRQLGWQLALLERLAPVGGGAREGARDLLVVDRARAVVVKRVEEGVHLPHTKRARRPCESARPPPAEARGVAASSRRASALGGAARPSTRRAGRRGLALAPPRRGQRGAPRVGARVGSPPPLGPPSLQRGGATAGGSKGGRRAHLRARRVDAHRCHRVAKLLLGDEAVAVLVPVAEEVEHLTEKGRGGGGDSSVARSGDQTI